MNSSNMESDRDREVTATTLAYLNDDKYYERVGENVDGLGGARGVFNAFCGTVLVVILFIELMAALAAFG